MSLPKHGEPGGYVTTSRSSLVMAFVLLLASAGVVWFFVERFSPPSPEEEETAEERPAEKKKDTAAQPRPALPPKAAPKPRTPAKPRPAPKTEPKPKPKPKAAPKVVTRAFQDGVAPDRKYKGTSDTYLFESNIGGVHGNHKTCVVDGDDPGGTGRDASAVFRWDVSSVPPQSTVRAVKLVFHVVDPSTDAYKIYAIKRAWSEKKASWRSADGRASWQKGGARGGNDRHSEILGTVKGNQGKLSVMLNAAGVVAVQSWVRDPDRNFGIIIAADGNQTNGLDLASREASDAAQRPRLEITYAVPPGP